MTVQLSVPNAETSDHGARATVGPVRETRANSTSFGALKRRAESRSPAGRRDLNPRSAVKTNSGFRDRRGARLATAPLRPEHGATRTCNSLRDGSGSRLGLGSGRLLGEGAPRQRRPPPLRRGAPHPCVTILVRTSHPVRAGFRVGVARSRPVSSGRAPAVWFGEGDAHRPNLLDRSGAFDVADALVTPRPRFPAQSRG